MTSSPTAWPRTRRRYPAPATLPGRTRRAQHHRSAPRGHAARAQRTIRPAAHALRHPWPHRSLGAVPAIRRLHATANRCSSSAASWPSSHWSPAPASGWRDNGGDGTSTAGHARAPPTATTTTTLPHCAGTQLDSILLSAADSTTSWAPPASAGAITETKMDASPHHPCRCEDCLGALYRPRAPVCQNTATPAMSALCCTESRTPFRRPGRGRFPSAEQALGFVRSAPNGGLAPAKPDGTGNGPRLQVDIRRPRKAAEDQPRLMSRQRVSQRMELPARARRAVSNVVSIDRSPAPCTSADAGQPDRRRDGRRKRAENLMRRGSSMSDTGPVSRVGSRSGPTNCADCWAEAAWAKCMRPTTPSKTGWSPSS